MMQGKSFMFFPGIFTSLLLLASSFIGAVSPQLSSPTMKNDVFIKKLGICFHFEKGLFFLRVALALLLVITLAPTTKAYAFKGYKIPSGGMKPTILAGDRIIANMFAYMLNAPKRNDIIIFEYPEDPTKDFIKRVVGIGGDVIEMRDKQLYVNGKATEAGFHADSNIYPKTINPRDNFGPVKVPHDNLFVLGDNRDYSHDSRFWGFVPLESVKGKALIIYWSQDPKTWKIRTDRIGTWIK
jgi:signal peptidase I